MNAWLMDLVFVLHWKYKKDEIRILSGYRTPKTNALQENPQQFESAAANSQHARAMALDIQIPDVDNYLVAQDVSSFIYGGVGMYPHRDFFHADFGPNRRSSEPSRLHVSSGSGFVVSRAGYLVTNAHVAAHCPSLTVNYRGREIAVKEVVAIDQKADLALLKVSEPWATASVISSNDIEIGDNIFALGFPLRGILSPKPIITAGIVNARAGIHGDRTQFQMSAPVQPGNSGGPVVDESGKVVGIVVAKLDALKMAKATGDIPENVNFAISLDTLRDFLRSNHIEFIENAERADLKPRDIAASVRQYTVAIDCWKEVTPQAPGG